MTLEVNDKQLDNSGANTDPAISASNGDSSLVVSGNPGRVNTCGSGISKGMGKTNFTQPSNKVYKVTPPTPGNIDSGNGSTPQQTLFGSAPQITFSTPVGDNCFGSSSNPPDGGIGSTPSHHTISDHITPSRLPPRHTAAELMVTSEYDIHSTLDSHKLSLHQQRVARLWPTITTDAAAEFPKFAKLYSSIKDLNTPNFLGAKVTLESDLNLDKWDQELESYHDRQVCHFLRFGWPVGYEADSPPVAVEENHQSGQQHLQHVRDFIQTELDLGALVGPFSKPPFQPWTRISPILTRPKKESENRRIIIDLSFPLGQAVNNGIDITSIFGHDSTYVLPTITDLTSKVIQLGKGSWIWKADLSRAYRQLRVDPLDCPLLGLQVDGKYYVDLCPSFGCRSSSAACQRTSNALTYIMSKAGCAILAYLDDYASCAPTKAKALHDYKLFMSTAEDLGLKLALDKCHPPTTSLEWLGFNISTISMTVSIPRRKLDEVLNECQLWAARSRTSKKRLQSLVGKLVHLSNGINHARKFTSRLLTALRGMADAAWTTISEEARLDIRWFLHYASIGNGVSFFGEETDYCYIECDACLTGAGGNSATSYYRWQFEPSHVEKYRTIHRLEAINLLVAYKTLAPLHHPTKLTVVLLTDNISSSYALSSGKTKDSILGACARQMWLEAACRRQSFIIQHKPGVDIPLADALSRYYEDTSKKVYADTETQARGLSRVEPVLHGYAFFTSSL